jgi:hypothetical protein
MEALITLPQSHHASMLVVHMLLNSNQRYEKTTTDNAMVERPENVQWFVHLLPHDLWRSALSTDNAVAHRGRKQKFC